MAPPDSPRDTAADPSARPAAEPFADGPSLVDVLGRLMDRGVVVEASARGALPELDLVAGEAAIAVAAVEIVAGDGDGWARLARVADATDAAAADGGGDGPRGTRRAGEHAALRRQFERLNA